MTTSNVSGLRRWQIPGAIMMGVVLGVLAIAKPGYANETIAAGGMNLSGNQNVYIGDGSYLIFLNSGSLVVYNSVTYQTLWSTNTDGRSCSSGCNAVFQTDGNLVLYQNGTAYWSSQTWGNDGASLLLSTQSPYLTIDNSAGSAIWNSTSGALQTGQPDMVVTGYSMSPANPQPGQAVTFSATVKNQGTAATPSGVINSATFQVDGTTVSWSAGYTSSIAPGQTVTLTADGGSPSATWSAVTGSHSLQVVSNDAQRFQESDFNNNTLNASFTVIDTSGSSEQARSADSFVDSIGVNTHLNWSGVWAGSAIIPGIESLGIRHIRDIVDLNPSLDSWWFDKFNSVANTVMNDTGVRIGYDYLLDYPGQWNCDFSQAPLNNILGYVQLGNIDTFEGLNEYNNFYTIGNCGGSWSAEDNQYQQVLYNTEKGISQLAGFPVIGPSLAWANSSDATALGQLGNFVDYGNQHSYPGGNYPPSHNIATFTDELNAANVYGGKPYIATESGYSTDTVDAGGVNEDQAGRYYSRLFFEYFNAGIVRTYAYDLIDDSSQSGLEAHYGLLHENGSFKPEATAVANEIALLKEPGASFTPGKLYYTMNAPSQVHHTLLEKSNGTFYLVLWQEVVAGASPVNVMISLANQPSQMNLYQPMVSSAATPVSVSQTVTVSVPDNVVILEIKP